MYVKKLSDKAELALKKIRALRKLHINTQEAEDRLLPGPPHRLLYSRARQRQVGPSSYGVV
jgi:hypothetical protein